MTTPYELLHKAASDLEQVAEALFLAADMMSDNIAEYHGDRGLGVPPRNMRLERLYNLSNEVSQLVGQVDAELGDM